MTFDYRLSRQHYRELDTVKKHIDQMGKAAYEATDNETFAALMDQALEMKMTSNQLLTSIQAMTNYRAVASAAGATSTSFCPVTTSTSRSTVASASGTRFCSAARATP